MAGDPASDIIYSGNFRARLAAQALGVPYDDVRRADLRTYSAIIERTLNFLLQPLGEMVLRQNIKRNCLCAARSRFNRFWMHQSLRELAGWMEIIERDNKKRK